MTFKQLRMRAYLSQTEICERTGLSKSQVSQYEHGKFAPNLKAIRKLCDVMGCTADELVFSETWGEK